MKFDAILNTCVKQDLQEGLIPMLLGEAGIGKSSWIENLAEEMGTRCFTLPCNQLGDKTDLTGARTLPVTDENGKTIDYKQMFFPHSTIYDAIVYADKNPRETPILFMDELNRTTPDVTSAALTIATLREIGSKKLPSNLRIVTAGNDKGNITSLDEASISRFVLYHVEPDVETFIEVNPHLNAFVKATLSKHPELIFCKKFVDAPDEDEDKQPEMFIEDILDTGESMNQITTPRTITAISNWLNGFTNDTLNEMLSNTVTVNGEVMSTLQEVIESHIGKTRFSIFLLEEITNNLATVDNQTNAITMNEPDGYADMKACPTVDDMAAFIDNLTDYEKSSYLVYAMYEHEDNEFYITQLAASISAFDSKMMQKLIELHSNGLLDRQNTEAMLASDSDITKTLSIVIQLD